MVAPFQRQGTKCRPMTYTWVPWLVSDGVRSGSRVSDPGVGRRTRADSILVLWEGLAGSVCC